jgi:glycosyltransferase involved in cell wall biosynthesis
VGFRSDVPRCLASFDAFVFTGIFKEGLTGTVREAGAMGLPIVCTDVGGNRELIRDGQTGLLIPVRDSRAVTLAMVNIRRHRSLAEDLAVNVRSFVERNMSDEVRCEKLTELYLRILDERRQAASR